MTHYNEPPTPHVEYRGTATFDNVGAAAMTLPGYFEAQTDPGQRAVDLSVEGAGGLPLSCEPILDGRFTVHGSPGKAFSSPMPSHGNFGPSR